MKKRVGIVFGGRSSEREISILSAASVIAAIDREKYEAVPFAIDRQGVWHLVETDLDGLKDLLDPRIQSVTADAEKVTISDFDSMTDFAFPVMHGPYGEDGTVQGLFEMLGKPYAGCGVLGAAVSMDKIITKGLWANEGFSQTRYTYTTRHACRDGAAGEAARIERELPYPIFVKPANMGSSIGISKVSDLPSLEAAIEKAFAYDKRVIAEQAVCGRELEIGVLGNGALDVSAIGEIIPEAAYYDYESKYLSDKTRLEIPGDIPENIREEIAALAKKAYKALDGQGYARVDLFYDGGSGVIYLNEMNSIPGLTRYSMFPKMWQASGVGFPELVERIIELGYERHNASYNR